MGNLCNCIGAFDNACHGIVLWVVHGGFPFLDSLMSIPWACNGSYAKDVHGFFLWVANGGFPNGHSMELQLGL